METHVSCLKGPAFKFVWRPEPVQKISQVSCSFPRPISTASAIFLRYLATWTMYRPGISWYRAFRKFQVSDFKSDHQFCFCLHCSVRTLHPAHNSFARDLYHDEGLSKNLEVVLVSQTEPSKSCVFLLVMQLLVFQLSNAGRHRHGTQCSAEKRWPGRGLWW